MKIGIIGAGQLARMLVLSGTPLGFTFSCIGKSGDCAGDVSSVVDIDLKDTKALLNWASNCDVVTFENENIDCNLIKDLHTKTNVHPPIASIEITQDRLLEKDMLCSLGIKTTPYKDIKCIEDLTQAVEMHSTPAIVKTRRFGYDGKGQFKLKNTDDIKECWDALGNVADGIIYEGFINFDKEVSMICSRNVAGNIAFYPLVHNIHDKGVLIESIAPYCDDKLTVKAQEIAKIICDNYNYVGTLAIEFFVAGDALIVNEIAPRVHNSGHWTIEGAVTSQFENHLRAISNLGLGSTDSQNTVMLNCLGGSPTVQDTSAIKNAKRHCYSKDAKTGRKIGHVTITMHSDTAKDDLKALRILVDNTLDY